MKTQITREEYWQLFGLMTLAHRYNRLLEEIERTASGIVGESLPNGHIADQVYSNEPADMAKLMHRLNVIVEGGVP